MDYNDVACKQKRIACVLSVEMRPDGGRGEICLEAANDIYLESVNVKKEDFVPGKPYYEYIPKDLNFEEMSYSCVKECRIVHSYVDAEFYHSWMEVVMMPLLSDEPGKEYMLFSYDMHSKVDASRLSDISPDIAVKVIRTSLRFKETGDFRTAIDSIIRDIRKICNANRSCIILTDFKTRNCSMLCESLSETEVLPQDEAFLGDGFFDIVEIWEKLIAGSNCYILHDEEGLEQVRAVDENWYNSLKNDNIYSVVLFPLRSNDETIGYIMATNFDRNKTEYVKKFLGVTSFILASEISNHQLFNRMKFLSDTDLLTGMYNRNAMNNRISDIISGICPVTDNYGVIFVDINGLKVINDTEGHTAGDMLLKAAACILKEMFPYGEIYRVGGDEFLILLMNEDEVGFKRVVDELKDRVEKTDEVKMAVGSCYADRNMDIRNAMHEADEAMYADKREYYKRHNIRNIRS
ncbi:MAG: sensor domain-containing diguanylate cyclase [Lachnospiraceae bacterium]|nr:sensor domain-containing diguanylate cyclase [Lachnospiraceae bacterium]